MTRRLNTIIIVPHSKAKFVKFSFSTRSFIVAAGGFGLALILSFIAIAYTGSAVQRRAEAGLLERENRELAQVNHQLEETLAEVQARLDEFEERTSRLALATGMETEALGSSMPPTARTAIGSGGPYDRMADSPEILRLQGDWIRHQLDNLEDQIAEQDERLASTPTVAPVRGLVTDPFGNRKDPFTGRLASHTGLDISARRGTPIEAPAAGVVAFTGRNGGLGKMVRISHGFGFTTVYGHLDSIAVQPGQEVERGDMIGALGNTGRSTGPHLHYEVHVDGRPVNPLYYILDTD